MRGGIEVGWRFTCGSSFINSAVKRTIRLINMLLLDIIDV